ncbi:MAG: TIGR03016 family PEP-CTERM system-associated outer membrane protein [Aromatoleum sp.]|nr:TIGR03016 family PEP-CTERM system-associated outer membrane protein [Aromatoleum sp.]
MRGACAAILVGGLALGAAPVGAQTWRFDPAISIVETATSNVNLDPSNAKRSDLATQISPSLTFSEKGPRTHLEGGVSIPILVYARTGAENNRVYPSASVIGDVELVRNFFHVEGAIAVAQQFFDPFGARPADLSTATDNRYRTDTYRVSPYIQGVAPGNISYELRNNNVWTNLSGAPITANNSRYTEWTGNVANTTAQLGWLVNFDDTYVRFNDQSSIRTSLARFVPSYNVDPQLRLRASVGYESNEYTLTSSRGTIYGAGFEWHPTDRTSAVANYEHRFFGASYLVSFDHRTPLSIWNVSASRNITTYPQQIGTLPAGLNVAGFVNGLFVSSIPDPAARQQAVDEFMRQRGLPAVLSNPIVLYGQQILLQEQQNATAGLIGARNVIVFSIFNVRNQPIAGSGDTLPPILALGNDNRQTGGSLVWTHNIGAGIAMNASLTGFRTVANPPGEAHTNQAVVNLGISMQFTPLTTVSAGARYQVLVSDVSSDYTEVAAFVGLTHRFK